MPAGQFFPKRTYGLVLRKGQAPTPQAQKFVDLLLDTSAHDDAHTDKPVIEVSN
jgi:hypothetical protein